MSNACHKEARQGQAASYPHMATCTPSGSGCSVHLTAVFPKAGEDSGWALLESTCVHRPRRWRGTRLALAHGWYGQASVDRRHSNLSCGWLTSGVAPAAAGGKRAQPAGQRLGADARQLGGAVGDDMNIRWLSHLATVLTKHGPGPKGTPVLSTARFSCLSHGRHRIAAPGHRPLQLAGLVPSHTDMRPHHWMN